MVQAATTTPAVPAGGSESGSGRHGPSSQITRRALCMTGRGESTDHIDGPLLHAELRRWIRADKSRENAVICLQRTKYAYEALAAVARTLSHPAMKLAWSLLLVETRMTIERNPKVAEPLRAMMTIFSMDASEDIVRAGRTDKRYNYDKIRDIMAMGWPEDQAVVERFAIYQLGPVQWWHCLHTLASGTMTRKLINTCATALLRSVGSLHSARPTAAARASGRTNPQAAPHTSRPARQAAGATRRALQDAIVIDDHNDGNYVPPPRASGSTAQPREPDLRPPSETPSLPVVPAARTGRTKDVSPWLRPSRFAADVTFAVDDYDALEQRLLALPEGSFVRESDYWELPEMHGVRRDRPPEVFAFQKSCAACVTKLRRCIYRGSNACLACFWTKGKCTGGVPPNPKHPLVKGFKPDLALRLEQVKRLVDAGVMKYPSHYLDANGRTLHGSMSGGIGRPPTYSPPAPSYEDAIASAPGTRSARAPPALPPQPGTPSPTRAVPATAPANATLRNTEEQPAAPTSDSGAAPENATVEASAGSRATSAQAAAAGSAPGARAQPAPGVEAQPAPGAEAQPALRTQALPAPRAQAQPAPRAQAQPAPDAQTATMPQQQTPPVQPPSAQAQQARRQPLEASTTQARRMNLAQTELQDGSASGDVEQSAAASEGQVSPSALGIVEVSNAGPAKRRRAEQDSAADEPAAQAGPRKKRASKRSALAGSAVPSADPIQSADSQETVEGSERSSATLPQQATSSGEDSPPAALAAVTKGKGRARPIPAPRRPPAAQPLRFRSPVPGARPVPRAGSPTEFRVRPTPVIPDSDMRVSGISRISYPTWNPAVAPSAVNLSENRIDRELRELFRDERELSRNWQIGRFLPDHARPFLRSELQQHSVEPTRLLNEIVSGQRQSAEAMRVLTDTVAGLQLAQRSAPPAPPTSAVTAPSMPAIQVARAVASEAARATGEPQPITESRMSDLLKQMSEQMTDNFAAKVRQETDPLSLRLEGVSTSVSEVGGRVDSLARDLQSYDSRLQDLEIWRPLMDRLSALHMDRDGQPPTRPALVLRAPVTADAREPAPTVETTAPTSAPAPTVVPPSASRERTPPSNVECAKAQAAPAAAAFLVAAASQLGTVARRDYVAHPTPASSPPVRSSSTSGAVASQSEPVAAEQPVPAASQLGGTTRPDNVARATPAPSTPVRSSSTSAAVAAQFEPVAAAAPVAASGQLGATNNRDYAVPPTSVSEELEAVARRDDALMNRVPAGGRNSPTWRPSTPAQMSFEAGTAVDPASPSQVEHSFPFAVATPTIGLARDGVDSPMSPLTAPASAVQSQALPTVVTADSDEEMEDADTFKGAKRGFSEVDEPAVAGHAKRNRAASPSADDEGSDSDDDAEADSDVSEASEDPHVGAAAALPVRTPRGGGRGGKRGRGGPPTRRQPPRSATREVG